jgi:hypothetical protein
MTIQGPPPPEGDRYEQAKRRIVCDTGNGDRSYGGHDMTHVLDIDPRIARCCLHAGRLQAGAQPDGSCAVRIPLLHQTGFWCVALPRGESKQEGMKGRVDKLADASCVHGA